MYHSPQDPAFDWPGAIERNRDALSAILVALFAMLGSVAVARIPRSLHRQVLRVLRPAESAVRRLVVIAARGLVVKPSPARAVAKGSIGAKSGSGTRPPSFPLFDTRKRFDLEPRRKGPRPRPRITTMRVDAWGDTVWTSSDDGLKAKAKAPDDGCIDAKRLSRRLEAIRLALADLPRQARRLVRARMRRAKVPRLAFLSPLRPGPAPGSRRKPSHAVDEVLAQCHWLAWEVGRLDTS